jgi:hypothetical protein
MVAPTHPLAGCTLAVEGHRAVGGERCLLVRLPDGSAGTIALSATSVGGQRGPVGGGALLPSGRASPARAAGGAGPATVAAHRLTS